MEYSSWGYCYGNFFWNFLRIWFLNRSYPGTPPFWCRELRPYHEEPRLKTSFIQFFLHLQVCFCTVHQWSHWPRYRLWVFNILKLSYTLEEEEEMFLGPFGEVRFVHRTATITELVSKWQHEQAVGPHCLMLITDSHHQFWTEHILRTWLLS